MCGAGVQGGFATVCLPFVNVESPSCPPPLDQRQPPQTGVQARNKRVAPQAQINEVYKKPHLAPLEAGFIAMINLAFRWHCIARHGQLHRRRPQD